MTPERRRQLLAASRLGRAVAGFAGPAGEKGDLDPDGHWRTVSGNAIHIDSNGEIDAGGPPVLRQILAEKAGLHPKGTKAAAEAGSAPDAPAEPPAKAKKVRLEGTDKSVRDMPTKVALKDGTFHVTIKVGRVPFRSFTVPAAEYPAGQYERTMYLRKHLGDYDPVDGARLIDSARRAIELVSQKARAAGVELPQAKLPGTPPKLADAVEMIGLALDGGKRLNMADVVKAVPDLHPRAVVAVVNQLYRAGQVKRFPDETFRLSQHPSVLRDLIRGAFRDLGVREEPGAPAGTRPAPPAPAVAPQPAPPPRPAAGGFGTNGDDHPLGGGSPTDHAQTLGRMASDDDSDPMRLLADGPPAGLDMKAFTADLRGAVGRHASVVGVGPALTDLYGPLGQKHGLSKHDFLRAVVAAHEAGAVRSVSWGKTTHEVPDPHLAPVAHHQIWGHFMPPSTYVHAIEEMAGEGDTSLNTERGRVHKSATAAPAAGPGTVPAAPPAKAKKTKAPAGPSHRTEITEGGKVFRTGEPVTFRMMRNLQPAPKRPKGAEDTYQQQVEPAGRYMTHDAGGEGHKNPAPSYAYEEVTFKNPLVVPLNTGGPNNRIYDENSWKMNLSREFGGKKGQSLSNAVARAGHDGIVTVDKYGTSEIVDLRHLHPKQDS